MFKRFQLFMGPSALRALIIWIALTGLASLILNVIVETYTWVRPVQTGLALAALIGAIVIILSRVDADDRKRWIAVVAPAVVAVILAVTILPQFQLVFFGAAAGWVVAGWLLFRAKTPPAYKQAVRHLRRNQLDEAVKMMDAVIRDDPSDPQHYRFRAELLRVWGKLDRARKDYARMVELAPESAVAHNGLAEVLLQSGQHEPALAAARRAAELAPTEWVALYNLGMIEDRLGQSSAVIASLNSALGQKIPDARHRLLIHLYMTRAYAHLGQYEQAEAAKAKLTRERAGLEEWQTLLASDQADTLRAVLGADIATAAGLLDGTISLEALATMVVPPPTPTEMALPLGTKGKRKS